MRCAGNLTGRVGDLGLGLINPPVVRVPLVAVDVTDDTEAVDSRGFCRCVRVEAALCGAVPLGMRDEEVEGLADDCLLEP